MCVGVLVPGEGLWVVGRDAGEVPAGPRRRVVDGLVARKVFPDDGDVGGADARIVDEAVGRVKTDDSGPEHDDVRHGVGC